MPRSASDELTSLLRSERWHGETQDEDEEQLVEFDEEDSEDPKQWPLRTRYFQVLQVTLIGLLCPLASSILAPASDIVAEEFGVEKSSVIGAQSGFVHMLGFGPLFLAPCSETFGRRPVFMTNLIIFTILQIPTALAPNLPALIALRTLSGLFGSVGIANGGGTISDMFPANERATVLGFYLLGPLLGPSLGPFIGGLVVSRLDWRWVIWTVFIMSTLLTLTCYFFLHESYAPMVLQRRKQTLQDKNPDTPYRVSGASDQPTFRKIKANCSRALRILFTQPIVLIMSIYQAIIFASMYTLYSTFTNIWPSPPYHFTKNQLALTYLAPATGFTLAAAIIVPSIDRLYKHLSRTKSRDNNRGGGLPEYRLPLACIGALLLPISLFWFGWAVEAQTPWPLPLASTLLFGAAQVCIFNTTQNYYIDAFEKYAASALAAGAFLRSMFGAQIPLYVGALFERLGYGWGFSVFGFVSVALMPAPALFYFYGGWVRERFAVDLS